MPTNSTPRYWAAHSAWSDPGRHRSLLQDLPRGAEGAARAARNVIGHYRAELSDLPEDRWDEVNSRRGGGHPRCRPGTPPGPVAPASGAWRRTHGRRLDVSTYCVFPGAPWAGIELVERYLIYDLMHRRRDELLLWDEWDAAAQLTGDVALDALADLTLSADSGDQDAERELSRLHRAARPSDHVLQHSPFGATPTVVALPSPPWGISVT